MIALARRAFAMLLLCGVTVAAPGGPPDTYSAAPIAGRVIDAETGEPIAGAVVVADWTVWQRGPFVFRASDRFRRFEVQEAITDAQGRYRLPGWGPVDRPPGWDFHPRGTDDPRLTAFKPGYDPQFLNNERAGFEGGEPFNQPEAAIRQSAWDGKDIALHKFGTFDRRTPGLVDRSYQASTPRLQSLNLLNNFAWSLRENVQAADDADASPTSERRLLIIRRQRQALLMADEALKEATGRAYDLNRWPEAVEDEIRQYRQKGGTR